MTQGLLKSNPVPVDPFLVQRVTIVLLEKRLSSWLFVNTSRSPCTNLSAAIYSSVGLLDRKKQFNVI